MRKRTTTASLAIAISILALTDVASAYYSPRLGRFINRDPISEPGAILLRTHQQPSRVLPLDPVVKDGNSYEFTVNNPTNKIDKLGLLSVGSPKAGLPHCKLNGQLVELAFDGRRLTASGFSADAVSGVPIKVSKRKDRLDPDDEDSPTAYITNYDFDYSQSRQQMKDVGPTPEGGYWFDVCSENNKTNRKAHRLHLSGWGKYSWPLTAWPTTQTYGRSDMFIHGGTTPGSKGCIDVLSADKELHSFLRRVQYANGCCCYVNVNVKYPNPLV